MANSSSFEGIRFSVKLPVLTVAHIEKEAKGLSREAVAREWVENWQSLAGLAPYLYQRLVYSAQQRRLPLKAVVNEALVQYCTALPAVKEGVRVETPIDLLDDDTTEDDAPKARARPGRKSGSR